MLRAALAVKAPPTRIGDYEVIGKLGQGGMGVVYRSRHVTTKVIVALKLIHVDALAADAACRLLRGEIETMAAVRHPNIVPVYDFGEHAGDLYYTMPLFDASLADRKASFGRPRAAARLLVKIARTVHYAHERGVLHGDLKPGNMLLDALGEPHVSDWDLAKFISVPAPHSEGLAVDGLGQLSAFSQTRTPRSTMRGGTLQYMSPEQTISGTGASATTASDVYSLGVIFYELLTGRPPFEGTAGDVLERLRSEAPRPPRDVVKNIHPDFEAICLKCLDRVPERRYRSAGELADDLERALQHEQPLVAPESRVRWAARILRRYHRAALAAVALATAPVAAVWLQTDALIRSTFAANSATAQVAAEAIRSQLADAMSALEAMAADPEVERLLDAPRLPEVPALKRFRSTPLDIIAVFDRRGILQAIWPKGRRNVVGRDYAWRDYFRNACDTEGPVRPGAYVARSYTSENDDDYNLGISAPIVRDNRCIGVVMATILTDSTFGRVPLPKDPRHKGVLLGPQDRSRGELGYPRRYLVLARDGLHPSQGVELSSAVSQTLEHQFGSLERRGKQLRVRDVDPLLLTDYRDPLSGDRWLAAFYPVGSTGLIVGSQSRYDLVNEIAGVGGRVVAAVAALFLLLSMLIARAERRARLRDLMEEVPDTLASSRPTK